MGKNPKTQRYNWIDLERRFLGSSYATVKEFFLADKELHKDHPKVTYTDYVKRKTKGWSDEKREILKKKKKEILEGAEKEIGKQFKFALKQLEEMENLIVNSMFGDFMNSGKELIDPKTKKSAYIFKMSIKDRKSVWEVIRTMQNKPMRVQKVDTTPPIDEDKLASNIAQSMKNFKSQKSMLEKAGINFNITLPIKNSERSSDIRTDSKTESNSRDL
jgi:hypothetical protein